MGLLLSLFFGIVPMLVFAWVIYWTDRYEKEPKAILGGVFTWGAIVAAGAAFFVNTFLGLGIYLFTNSEQLAEVTTTSLVAPVVEELLKGFAVLIVFAVARQEFDSYLDGIVYAAITALGFAATENVFYIYTRGYQESGLSGLLALVFIRVILVGWQHPFYTAFTGIGLAAARLNQNLAIKILAPLSGLSVAVLTHSFHNTMGQFLSGLPGLAIGALFDWTGWLFMILFIIWAVYREKNWLRLQLREEVSLGVISASQYRTACSAISQGAAKFGALFSGHYRATRRFYQVCAELAFKKQQRQMMGEETGNSHTIQELRNELMRLAPLARI